MNGAPADLIEAAVVGVSLRTVPSRKRGRLVDGEIFGLDEAAGKSFGLGGAALLETIWDALEACGYNGRPHEGPIGLYLQKSIRTEVGLRRLGKRIAEALGLRGPVVTLDAESCSLTSIALAHKSLLSSRCAIAIAGAWIGNGQAGSGKNGKIALVILRTIAGASAKGDPILARLSVIQQSSRGKEASPARTGLIHLVKKIESWRSTGPEEPAGCSFVGRSGNKRICAVPARDTASPPRNPRSAEPLLLSAATSESLTRMRRRLGKQLQSCPVPALQDVAGTLLTGKTGLSWRFADTFRDSNEAGKILASASIPAKSYSKLEHLGEVSPVFLFPGVGNQYAGMALPLYRSEPEFARQIDGCCEILAGWLGAGFKDDLLSPPEPQDDSAKAEVAFASLFDSEHRPAGAPMSQTGIAQPALFVLEYALAQLWRHWGVQPVALAGYSIGECVAACLAGVFSLKDALSIVARRALLCAQLPRGAMLAIPLAAKDAAPWLKSDVAVCGHHGPRLCVVAGPCDAIAETELSLSRANIASRRLNAELPFHTPRVAAIAPALRELVASVPRSAPSIPFISNRSGSWITAAEAVDPDYWAAHLCAPVRFGEGIQTLAASGVRLFVEVGPGRSLSSLVNTQLLDDGIRDGATIATLPASYENLDHETSLLKAVCEIWKRGVSVDCERFYSGRGWRRATLPPYPFGHRSRRREISPSHVRSPGKLLNAPPPPPARQAPARTDCPIIPATRTEVRMAALFGNQLGRPPVKRHQNFFELGGDSLSAVELVTRIRREFGAPISLGNLLQFPTVAALSAQIEAVTANASRFGEKGLRTGS
jgi:acyl transferase domain-containing protein/acyl carrier protein